MNEDYLNIISGLDNIVLVIMGKDPFPTNENGIPFCKPNWNEQLAQNSSGFFVLNSLGLIPIDKEKYPTPKDFFLALASKGVVFLNLSYEFIGEKIRKKRHAIQIQNGFRINEPILNNSENIILCGEANKNRWNTTVFSNAIEIVHPDFQNHNKPKTRNEWLQYWSAGKLNDLFNLNI